MNYVRSAAEAAVQDNAPLNMDQEQMLLDLAEPFPVGDLRFKPVTTSGERAIPVAFIDARDVMDRLDEVVGAHRWSDDYTSHENGCVVCRLSVNVGGAWITKVDVGSPSEQPDDGDKVKAAFSDALKRAAVKFGIGRYLYRLSFGWQDYDPKERHFKARPPLPAWALPKLVAPADVAEIERLANEAKINGPKLAEILDVRFGVGDTTQLSAKQAVQVLEGLKKKLGK